jgi:putative ABC transport system substrate-binding protein
VGTAYREIGRAGENVRREVAVIAIPNNTASALATKAATQTIPIVFNIGSDPIAMGLVATLSHPGKNATGAFEGNGEQRKPCPPSGLAIELLKEMVPGEKARRYSAS